MRFVREECGNDLGAFLTGALCSGETLGHLLDAVSRTGTNQQRGENLRPFVNRTCTTGGPTVLAALVSHTPLALSRRASDTEPRSLLRRRSAGCALPAPVGTVGRGSRPHPASTAHRSGASTLTESAIDRRTVPGDHSLVQVHSESSVEARQEDGRPRPLLRRQTLDESSRRHTRRNLLPGLMLKTNAEALSNRGLLDARPQSGSGGLRLLRAAPGAPRTRGGSGVAPGQGVGGSEARAQPGSRATKKTTEPAEREGWAADADRQVRRGEGARRG